MGLYSLILLGQSNKKKFDTRGQLINFPPNFFNTWSLY